MSAQIILFPAPSIRLDFVTEQFLQHAIEQYPQWQAVEDELDESIKRMFLWICWNRWKQSNGYWDMERPDLAALVHRVVAQNNRH